MSQTHPYSLAISSSATHAIPIEWPSRVPFSMNLVAKRDEITDWPLSSVPRP